MKTITTYFRVATETECRRQAVSTLRLHWCHFPLSRALTYLLSPPLRIVRALFSFEIFHPLHTRMLSAIINPLNAELNPICHLLVLLGDLTIMGPCIVSIFQYTYPTRCNVTQFICSTCFEWYFHPPSGAHTPVSTASGICHAVTAICRYRGRVGTGLSVLWVAYATHSTLKPIPTDSGR
jgi:hypothetical protein